MGDLNTPNHRLIVARLELQIEQQRLVIEQRDLRRSEIADERRHVEADIASHETAASEIAGRYGQVRDKATTEAKRLAVQRHELAVLVQGRKIRLLELDEEDLLVIADVAASEAHITKIEAEVGQQRNLIKTAEK